MTLPGIGNCRARRWAGQGGGDLGGRRHSAPPPLHRCWPGSRSQFMELPGDVWQHISDFLQSGALSHVCGKTWAKLQGQHLRPRPFWTPGRVAAAVRRWQATLRTARLHFGDAAPAAATRGGAPYATLVAALRGAPALHTIHLDLRGREVADAGAAALAALKAAPALRDLRLNLEGCGVGDAGAQALAGLREAPALQALRLELRGNGVGDAGAHALAALTEARALRTLGLDLGGNQLGDAGAQALAALRAAPLLRALYLNLRRNELRDSGAQVCAPSRTPTSHTPPPPRFLREVLEWPYTGSPRGSPPSPNQSDHCGGKRKCIVAKIWLAIFGTQPFGSQTPVPPPPAPLLHF